MNGITEIAFRLGRIRVRMSRGAAMIYRIVLITGFLFLFVTGCQKGTESERTDVDFSVMTAGELPEELLTILEENKEKEMRLTWVDQDVMYLVRGYGKQDTGGYSIAVAACAEDEETLWFDTRLIGPQDEESLSGEGTCPYLVVKIAATDKEVVIE